MYGIILRGLADRVLSCRARLGKAYSKSVGWYGPLQGGASAFHLTYSECAGPVLRCSSRDDRGPEKAVEPLQ